MAIKEIDFLPASYRVASQLRATTQWRVVVAVLCAVVLLAAIAGQSALRINLQRELDIVRVQYLQAQEQRARLAQLEQRRDHWFAAAELLTYLRHPWPRTQVLATALGPLPPSITLTRLALVREATPAPAYRSESSNDAEADTTDWPPTRHDHRQLQRETDAATVVVHLEGTTTDTPALHSYVAVLGGSRLFNKTEVTLVEVDRDENSQRYRFQARLILRPGWGQQGGPEVDAELSHARQSTALSDLAHDGDRP